jgi:hypothetical protein
MMAEIQFRQLNDKADAVAAVSTPTGVVLASDLAPEATEGRVEEVGDDMTPCARVSGAGTMTPHGYAPENIDHFDRLTEIVNGRRIGRDPMALPVAILTAAGHGPRRTSSIVSALGEVPRVDGLKRCKHLRRQCLACAENSAEVRRCAIIDCPVWPYRMGKNPHDPRRGVNPFAAAGITAPREGVAL